MATAFAGVLPGIPDGRESDDVASPQARVGQSRVSAGRLPEPGLRLLELRRRASAASASSPKRAAKCTPTGSPSFDQCSGSEAAGWPVMLKMRGEAASSG